MTDRRASDAAQISRWCGSTVEHDPHEWSYDKETFICSGDDGPDADEWTPERRDIRYLDERDRRREGSWDD